MNYNKVVNAFERYVKKYDENNYKVRLKHKHVYKVADISELLAKMLNLTEEEILLAKVIGLLHDIGRFEQATKYNTFKDIGFDHANYGVEILFEKGLIREFIEIEKYDSIIYNAIKYHNKISLPSNLDDTTLMFCKIIRDSDKIDIFRVLATEYEENLNDSINEQIIHDFMLRKPINYNLVNNDSDKIILDFALIFDINYKESFEILNNTKNLDNFINCIKVSEDNKSLFEEFKKIVKSVMEENLC